MLNLYKKIFFKNKGTFSLIVILIVSFFLKNYFELLANFLYGKITIIQFFSIYIVLGSLGLPTIPLAILGYKLYGIIICSLYSGFSVTMIILFQINFYKTLGLRISKDLYIRNITKTISKFNQCKQLLIIGSLRMNPFLPVHLVSGVSRNLLVQKRIFFLKFIIIIYLSSVICSFIFGLLLKLIDNI